MKGRHWAAGATSQRELYEIYSRNMKEKIETCETSWDLELGALCCSACTWTNVSSSNKIQRNYKEIKITACMHSWSKLWTKSYKKTKNPTATSEELGAKAEYSACPLHTTPPKG